MFATRIVRGLFYFEKGFRLADSYEAIAFADPIRGQDPASIVRVVSFMLQKPAKVIGNNVFRYAFEFNAEDPNQLAWLMVFYESMLFLGWTSPIETTENEMKG